LNRVLSRQGYLAEKGLRGSPKFIDGRSRNGIVLLRLKLLNIVYRNGLDALG